MPQPVPRLVTEPRDSAEAAGSTTTMLAVSALALFLDSVVQVVMQGSPLEGPSGFVSPGFLIPGVALPVILTTFAWQQSRRRGGYRFLTRVTGPVSLVVFILVVNLLTADASAGAQFFVLLPLLYAAYNLYMRAALVVAVLAVMAQIVLTFTLLPPTEAFHDSLFGGIILASLTVLVNLLRDSHDAARDKLAYHARRDPLTGLVNRIVVEKAAQTALAEPAGAALVLVDLDRFKAINDTFGHPAGDQVLQAFARVLTASTREHDIVARLGGDEMVVLTPGGDVTDAHRLAERLVAGVAATVVDLSAHHGPHRVTISASAGVAHLPGPATFTQLYKEADDSLYAAKLAGRGRVGG